MTKRVTKIPGFSGLLSKDTDPALASKVNAIAEAVDVRLGRRGDPLDRAVTVRELADAGLITTPSGTFSPSNPKPGFLPAGTFADRTVPPQPTGVTATGGYSVIQVYWDFPLYGNHSSTEIWRNDANVIGDAILVGTSGGRSFIDPVGGAADYYYWVRHVSNADIPGPFHATLGAYASTASDVSTLLTVLNGSISASQLTSGLLEMIDGAGSAIELAALQTFVGYDAGYTGDPLLTLIDTNKTLLDNVKDFTGWYSGYTGDALITRTTSLEGTQSTHSTKITALETTVNNGSTGVAATSTALGLLTTRVTTAEGTITSQGSAITALQSTVNNGSTGVAATAAALATLTTTVTSLGGTVSSNSSAITTLQNTVNDPSTGVAANASAVSALGSRVTTAEGNITSQGSAITALQSTVNNPSTGVTATASALSTLTTTVTSQGGSITTLSGQYTSLSTTVGGHTSTISSHTTSINGLSAEYMVKVNVNGRVSGFGLVGGSTSAFTILADQFSIVSPVSDAMVATPFIVQATSTTVGGVSVPAGVYISNAFIMNGSIVNAQIANAAIDDAKISNLSANKITTGTLDTSRLNIDGATLISDGGVLKLGTVDISNLTAGSITADYIAANGVNIIDTFSAGSVSIPTNATYVNVLSTGNVYKDSGTEGTIILEFQLDVGAPGSGAYAYYVKVFFDGVEQRLFSYYLQKSFTHTVSGRIVLQGKAQGNHTYVIQGQANISGSGTSGVTNISSEATVTDVKR